MTVTISDARIAPVAEDLTKDDLSLQVLRGFEKANRIDKAYVTGAAFAKGEWAVLNADGKVDRAGATAVPGTYLVWAGTDRYDTRATGMVTLLQGPGLVVKSSKYDAGATYAVNDYLTVKDLGSGESCVTLAAGSDAKLARVMEVGNGYLVYETLSV